MGLKKSSWFLIGFVIFYIVVLFVWWNLSWATMIGDYENGGAVTYWFPDMYITALVVIIGIIGFLVFFLLRRKEKKL
jgi:hypothetical protein